LKKIMDGMNYKRWHYSSHYSSVARDNW
jgi:hypothetical protein